MDSENDRDDSLLRLMSILSILLSAVTMAYFFFQSWQNGTLGTSVKPVPMFFLILGGFYLAWGLWRKSRYSNWIGVGYCVAHLLYRIQIGTFPTGQLGRDVLTIGGWLLVGYLLWTLKPASERVHVAPKLSPRLLEAMRKIKSETSHPKGCVRVILNSRQPLNLDWLSSCVEKVTGKTCTVSDSQDNIEFGAETGSLTSDEAIVGGWATGAIIGLKSFKFQVMNLPWVIGTEESNGSSSDSSGDDHGSEACLLRLSVIEAWKCDTPLASGCRWLAPLALGMWTDDIVSMQLDDGDKTTEISSKAELYRLAISSDWDGFGTLQQLNS